MAGMGFELRKLLQRDSYFCAGPGLCLCGADQLRAWVLVHRRLAVIGVMSVNIVVPNLLVTQFRCR